MKRTKLLALALAGVMALALLTGCSDSRSKAKQVEECFRSLMKQNVDYQKDETLDKKLEAIAQQFQPDWLDDRNGGLTEDARSIIRDELSDYVIAGDVTPLGRRSEAGPEYADAGGEYEEMQGSKV